MVPVITVVTSVLVLREPVTWISAVGTVLAVAVLFLSGQGVCKGRCGDLDGLICATDTMAAVVMQYLREYGIEVPGQILVAGQGDSDMSRVTTPPLITVHYSYEKSGELTVQMLMEALGQEEAAL